MGAVNLGRATVGGVRDLAPWGVGAVFRSAQCAFVHVQLPDDAFFDCPLRQRVGSGSCRDNRNADDALIIPNTLSFSLFEGGK